jgi:outer membrane protein TolC
MRLTFIYTFILIVSQAVWAQSLPVDSLPQLSFGQYLQLIKEFHPNVKQAFLLNRTAEMELLGAKGGFDPKVFGDYERKSFDGKNYFATGEYGVKVPTWYGIELKGGYNTASGDFLNDENKLPKQGQAILGISMPLLQNLLLDERRANLQKARQAQSLYEAERNALLNDMGLEAAKVYWKWAFSYQQLKIYEKALNIAENRFKAIRESFILGDRMAMDTLESFTQVQDRSVQYNEAAIEFQENSLKLSNFLWAKDLKPVDYQYQWQPQGINADEILINNIIKDNRNNLVQELNRNHPSLRVYQFKLAQLDVDRRLKMEKLKPKLNINYNILGNGLNFPVLLTDNYKWGISFSTSTLFRSERSDVQLARIKIENTTLMQQQKTLELQNKLRLAFNELDNLQKQITTYNQAVANYQQLLQLENTRFELGESTFFLINSREMKFLESQIKLAKLFAEYKISLANIDWASGKAAF